MKLEKLVDSVLHLHEERLSSVKRDIRIPYQLNFPQIPTTSKNKVLMGRYYEFVTQAFYGGKLSDLRYFDNKNNEQEELFLIKPDIIDNKRKKIAESKACVSGHKLNLMDEQIERYKFLQYDNPDSIVYFAVYRHILMGIKSKYKGSEDELFKELSKKTKFSIVLPLSIILSLYESRNQEVVSRYDGEKFSKCTSLHSPTINRFLTEPKKVINQLGLNLNNFVFNRFLSPKDFIVNETKIKRFPLVIISDVNHEDWVSKFKEQYDKENPIPF